MWLYLVRTLKFERALTIKQVRRQVEKLAGETNFQGAFSRICDGLDNQVNWGLCTRFTCHLAFKSINQSIGPSPEAQSLLFG